ncbi:MAG: tetratricopeptide repeat protein, partial [Thiogranum sp.]
MKNISVGRGMSALTQHDLEMSMKAFNGLLQKLLIVVLTVGALSACGGKEERKAKYFEKGKAYLAEENYEKARVEFKNVLQIDPKDAEGYFYSGQVEEKMQEWPRAFANYEKAIKLDPGLIKARIRLARIYMAQAAAQGTRNDKEALANVMALLQEQIKEIRSRAPEDPDGLTLEATLWANDGEIDRAIEQLERGVEKAPGHQSAVILLSSLYERGGRKDAAEQVLENALASGGGDPAVLRKRLSRIYALHGKDDKAVGLLREIVRDNPADLAPRLDLAAYLARAEKLDEAEQVLRDSIAAAPDDAERYLLLADFLATKRGKQAAVDELVRTVREKPELADVSFGLVKLYLSEGRQDEAKQVLEAVMEQQGTEPAGLKARVALAQLLAAADAEDERVAVLIAEVLTENPRDNGALLLKGKLAAKEKNYVDAIGDFRSVLKDQPDSEEVLLLLSAAHLANEESELAVDTLLRGIESNPGSVRLRLRLAELLARQGNSDNALQQLDLVLEGDPHNDLALRAKYELLARMGDVEGVEKVARLMQEADPEKETG